MEGQNCPKIAIHPISRNGVSIYKLKEKWAECYMRNIFSLGVRTTQLSESFNNALKNHLKSVFHIIVRFLKHFERAVEVEKI